MPDSIGQYQVLEDRTASGGPIRARDLHAGRTVLIRRIDRARLTDNALAAARTATTISHPNVASVYGLAEDEKGPYIVTEFVAGDALNKVLDGRPMNPQRALEVAAQLADGLAEVHSLGLVHGDISPATVAITSKGQVKLFDVGVPLEAIGQPAPDRSSSAKSLAPEQALGLPTDARTDLFSFGSLLYTMVVGEPPFAAATTTDPVTAVLQGKFVPPTTKNPSLPPALDRILERALSRSVETRYQSAAEMAADLREIAEVAEARAAVPPPAREHPRASGRGSLVGVLLVVVLLLAAAAWWFLSR